MFDLDADGDGGSSDRDAWVLGPLGNRPAGGIDLDGQVTASGDSAAVPGKLGQPRPGRRVAGKLLPEIDPPTVQNTARVIAQILAARVAPCWTPR